MEYERRKWSDGQECLYTDDPRAIERASESSDLRVITSYFRSGRPAQPFAWDIVGHTDSLSALTRQLQNRRVGETG